MLKKLTKSQTNDKRVTQCFGCCKPRAVAWLFIFFYCMILSCLPNDIFVDRQNYLNYVVNSKYLLDIYWQKGILYFFSNEPMWLTINLILDNFFQKEIAVKVIIFFSAFLSAIVLVRNCDSLFFSILFLLFIPVILNYLVHIRQGFALSVFLYGYFSSNKKIKKTLIIFSPFIHSSFFIINFVYFLSILLKFLRIEIKSKGFISIITLIIIGRLIYYFADLFQARQSMELINLDISGAAFMFWGGICFLFILESKEFLDKYFFETLMIVFYLLFYFSNPFIGRIIEDTILLIFIASMHLTKWRKLVFLNMFLFFFCIVAIKAIEANFPNIII